MNLLEIREYILSYLQSSLQAIIPIKSIVTRASAVNEQVLAKQASKNTAALYLTIKGIKDYELNPAEMEIQGELVQTTRTTGILKGDEQALVLLCDVIAVIHALEEAACGIDAPAITAAQNITSQQSLDMNLHVWKIDFNWKVGIQGITTLQDKIKTYYDDDMLYAAKNKNITLFEGYLAKHNISATNWVQEKVVFEKNKNIK